MKISYGAHENYNYFTQSALWVVSCCRGVAYTTHKYIDLDYVVLFHWICVGYGWMFVFVYVWYKYNRQIGIRIIDMLGLKNHISMVIFAI